MACFDLMWFEQVFRWLVALCAIIGVFTLAFMLLGKFIQWLHIAMWSGVIVALILLVNIIVCRLIVKF